MRDVGLEFGPGFQKLVKVESIAGSRHNRALLSLSEPSSTFPQSLYPLHPASIDGCFQSGVPSLWQGHRTSMNTVLVPAVIDNLVINSQSTPSEIGMAVASAEYIGAGRPELAKSYRMHSSVYDCKTGKLLFQMTGLRCNSLDMQNPHLSHSYTRLAWKPDISFLLPDQLRSITTDECNFEQEQNGRRPLDKIQQVIDLIVHKTPDLAVMEFDMLGSPESAWLDGISSSRLASRRYIFASATARTLLDTQDKYGASGNSEFKILDLTTSGLNPEIGEKALDLVIIKQSQSSEENMMNMLDNARRLLCDTGHVLLMNYSFVRPNSHSNSESTMALNFQSSLQTQGFQNVFQIFQDSHLSDGLGSAYVAAATLRVPIIPERDYSVDLISLSSNGKMSCTLEEELRSLGWNIRNHNFPFDSLKRERTILVLDELFSPVLSAVNGKQWKALKQLVNQGSKIFWVTMGSQFHVTHPDHALIHGFARTLRAEDPSLALITLDLKSKSSSNNASHINQILEYLQSPLPRTHIDNEFCERGGVLHISRVLPDNLINQAERDSIYGAQPVMQSLHGHRSCVRLRCERVGTLDSLHYAEVSDTEIRLGDTFVEVDLHAAALNFKVITDLMYIRRSVW